jgi:hypothetical protein
MKYIKYILEFVESYQWKLIDDDVEVTKYQFSDSFGNRYLVEFKNIKVSKNRISNQYEMVYFVYDDQIDNWSVSKLVSGNPYRTLQTIFGEILIDFVNRNRWIKMIRMVGLSKDLEREYVSQRTKMYVRYLTMNPIVGWKLVNYGNQINLVKYE